MSDQQGPVASEQPTGAIGPPPHATRAPSPRRASRVGMVVAAVAIVVALASVVALGVVLINRDNDDPDRMATPQASESAQASPASPTSTPSGTPTASSTRDAPRTPRPTTTRTPGKVVAPDGALAASHFSDLGKVCEGSAITNSAVYDPAIPAVTVAHDSLERGGVFTPRATTGPEAWHVDYRDFEDISVVMCAKAMPGSSKDLAQCEGTDSNGVLTKYVTAGATYEVTFVEARTGATIGQGSPLTVSDPTCPGSTSLGSDGKAATDPPADQLDGAVNAFTFR